MKKNHLRLMIVFCAWLLLFTACKKDKDTDTEYESAQDNSFAENSYEEATDIADQAMEGGNLTVFRSAGGSKILSDSCATITLDSIGIDHWLLTVDFGPTYVQCNTTAKRRKGKILVDFSGHYRDVGHQHIISFENYFVNDYKIGGTKTVENTGLNSAGHTEFDINVNGQITDPNGRTMTWTSQRVREWIEGEGTTFGTNGISGITDDVYLVTGSASGTSFSGTSFTVNITKALRVQLDCRHIVSGKFELTPSGKATRYFDYGNGICDTDATVTINDNIYNIKLK
jgi:hypothetical protein